ncbi:fucose isomerase [Synoicihabitans lomoniglobus]|uniref:Fucose isomerase n=1 Tax=Synoicihabitans lomoniglobus TaxID=2909285 RepID=A0AAE9ZZG3_9BACT|nr:fucose isomerase [Opitutaceae bacterium LMO-M01]WED63397.1 fucose isomerase [Opitutaceae bacterium LMO-M01]
MSTSDSPSLVYLVANGDLRPSANVACWPGQVAMEKKLHQVVESLGARIVRAHPFDKAAGHGFISSQKQGMAIFADLPPTARVIVAESVWQYSHHVLAGLISHRGPILTVANWSGEAPGLVGMLNLNGSLTKAGVRYSTLWSESFEDDMFREKLSAWLSAGVCGHEIAHVHPFEAESLPPEAQRVAAVIAADLRRHKSIMGVFDEGCMGMFNAIIPDALLFPCGVFKERLSQSALYYATTEVPEAEARAVLEWYLAKGLTFHFGTDSATELTEDQVLQQCKLYIAAVRIADEFGCETIGIQYQQGLKDLLPASDLAEGTLNNDDRPPVARADGSIIRAGEAIVHFNEVDECAGLDGLLINRVHRAMKQPVETTLHDLRWGDRDASGTVDDYVWVWLISGSAPPAHHVGGWAGSDSHRQPPMYFRLGGGSLRGVAKPGEIVWSRIYVTDGRLNLDIGRGKVVELPAEETERRWQATTYQWPIMHAVTYGVSRDQMMARHQANHVQVAYAHSADEADATLQARAALAHELGITVSYCGTRADGSPF